MSPAPSVLRGPPQPDPVASDLNALLARGAAHGGGVTFVDVRERSTYRSWTEVRGRARRVAAALADRGVAPGERVALVLRTEPAFLDGFFGVLLAGAVPVPLYPPVRLGRLEEYLAATARMVAVSGARIVLAGDAVRPLLGEVVARARPALGCEGVEALARGGAELERPVAPADLALVQFSSGSTVDPKPVALTHDNVVAQTASFLAALRPGASDVLVSWLPLYHDMGLIGCLLGALSHPGPLVLLAPEHFLARPALWLRTIALRRGTISAAPSFAYAYAAERVRDADLEGLDLSTWRVALNGAEPVSAEVLRRFASRFAGHGFDARALMPVYGLSEASLAVTFTPLRAGWRSLSIDPRTLAAEGAVVGGRREVVSVGVPVAGVELEVRSETGQVVPERTLGRIFTRGRSVMRGYLGAPPDTAAVGAGWIDTGDLGFVDGGELYVHGRSKDVVLVRGANHAPDDLEAALAPVPGIRTGCVVAVGFEPTDGVGEELLILAERSGPPGDDATVAAAARAAILRHAGVAPHTVALLAPGTLPRTSSGKMRRAEALRRHLAGHLTPPRSVTRLRMVAAVVRSAFSYLRARLGAAGARQGTSIHGGAP